ncbi:MAG: flagellar basal body P-ring protein FlgI [Planctomycetaceae bacterium]|nr:flagellar basal body P-ring protein FlgI [Planctomycetaceae bacterium]
MTHQYSRIPHGPPSGPQLLRWLLTALVCSTGIGCAGGLMNLSGASAIGTKFADLVGSNEPKRFIQKEEDNDFSDRIETPLLGDYISVTGNTLVVLRGVGLVTGLDGTGGDPPPSHLRKELMDEMVRRNIRNPGRILASRNTALVMVTAYLPAMVREGQRFDVRVSLPPNSEATSLRGGYLLETRMSEEVTVSGRGNLKGHHYATAQGAILMALGDGGKSNSAAMRRGSIPGGAVSNTERNLEVILRDEYRGLKTSKQVENAISKRLHHYDRYGQRIAMAEAKSDVLLTLGVHPTYRNNFPRYQQVIRSIAFRESDVARRLRMEQLGKEIMEPASAERSALQLEAAGPEGIPFLKAALKSDHLEVRFHAAQALAYLEDSSGVAVLKQAAVDEPAFRVYALAALSVIDDADGIMAMRELLSNDTLETRYGAVRALKENNPHDSSLGTVEYEDRFVLHAIDCSGPPAVHVLRYRLPEVVLFGRRQELLLPATLNAGTRILVKGEGGTNEVTITKYVLGGDSVKVTCSTNLADIINQVAKLGGAYPDVVQMLLEAETQHNLQGELGVDRLPQGGRTFFRYKEQENDEADAEESSAETKKKAKLGTPALTPGLFDRLEDDESDTSAEDSSALARMFAQRDAEKDDKGSKASPSESDAASGPAFGTATSTSDAKTSSKTTEESNVRSASFSGETSAGSDAAETEALDSESDETMSATPGVEKSSFREPLGVKMKRVMFGPFRNKD